MSSYQFCRLIRLHLYYPAHLHMRFSSLQEQQPASKSFTTTHTRNIIILLPQAVNNKSSSKLWSLAQQVTTTTTTTKPMIMSLPTMKWSRGAQVWQVEVAAVAPVWWRLVVLVIPQAFRKSSTLMFSFGIFLSLALSWTDQPSSFCPRWCNMDWAHMDSSSRSRILNLWWSGWIPI